MSARMEERRARVAQRRARRREGVSYGSSHGFDPAWERFADSEYLRQVLLRIGSTQDGWRTDPEADDLVRYAADRFARLARKHGLEEADAMSVAFEALRSPTVRFTADDPWAVVVRAVATTMRAWQFADEALTSLDTARRGGLSGRRAERMSERDVACVDCDPVWIQPGVPEPDDGWEGPGVYEQAVRIARLLNRGGWPFESALLGVDVVLRKLAETGSRPACYEALRREARWRAMAGIPAPAWTGLLRLLLGVPSPDKALTPQGEGLLLRIALGEDVEADPQVAADVRALWPRDAEGVCGGRA